MRHEGRGEGEEETEGNPGEHAAHNFARAGGQAGADRSRALRGPIHSSQAGDKPRQSFLLDVRVCRSTITRRVR